MSLPLLLLCLIAGSVALPNFVEIFNETGIDEGRRQEDPEMHMDPLEIAHRWGYVNEKHEVIADGYVLALHRIPYGKNGEGKNDPNRPRLYLQHGLGGDSSDWVLNLPWESPAIAAFVFADSGFDVWMGNFRGNVYSRKHVSLSPDDDKFWQFTGTFEKPPSRTFRYDEHASSDMPTMLNYILNETKQSQLYYVGHSEGTMVGFAQFPRDPVLAAKIKTFFALAPVAHLGSINGLLRMIAPFIDDLEFLFEMFGGMGQFMPKSELMQAVQGRMCEVVNVLCADVMFLIGGVNTHQFNMTRVPIYKTHSGGTSSLNMVHFGQNVRDDKFRMFDYGIVGNIQHYGQASPPMYSVKNMTAPPTVLFYSDPDILADKMDVSRLLQEMPASTVRQKFHPYDFNHYDFIYGLNAAAQIYKPMIDIINSDKR